MTRRRVVTGVDVEGRSVVVSNGPSSGGFGDSGWEELWAFDGVPARLHDEVDPVDVPLFRLAPAKDRIAVRIVTFRATHDPQRIEAERAPDEQEWTRRMDLAEVESGEFPPDVWMHRTPSIDVVVIISGEVDLVLDGGEEVHLLPGDSVIQRATMHAWRNTGREPFVAVAFCVGAE
jgi:mannose-6-phosphate isomerase-like protein (cupin superfamily)